MKDFDNIYLGIALNRPDRLNQSISEIKREEDLEDLEKSIADSIGLVSALKGIPIQFFEYSTH